MKRPRMTISQLRQVVVDLQEVIFKRDAAVSKKQSMLKESEDKVENLNRLVDGLDQEVNRLKRERERLLIKQMDQEGTARRMIDQLEDKLIQKPAELYTRIHQQAQTIKFQKGELLRLRTIYGELACELNEMRFSHLQSGLPPAFVPPHDREIRGKIEVW